MAHLERIIVLVDMDCFYCQVEEQLDHSLKGKPLAVVQYNAWRGGGIIAVNYAARDRGVTRHMRGEEAQQKCPDIVLARVPNKQGKADISKYREAGKRVATVLNSFTPMLERASVDEAYLDITKNVLDRLDSLNSEISPALLAQTYVVGYKTIDEFLGSVYSSTEDMVDQNLLKLAIAGTVVFEIRQAVYEQTGYQCSAGIAHNKILAKLACGINKPNKQTILPHDQVPNLFSSLSVKKIKSLGGKFGDTVCETLGITYMSELTQFSEKHLQLKFNEKSGNWLYNMARGIDHEPVVQRLTSKSIGCCKKFPGRTAITGFMTLKHWLTELAAEIAERLEADIIENSRRAKQLVVSYTQEIDGQDVASSRSSPLSSYDADKISTDSLEIVKKSTSNFFAKNSETVLALPIKFLGLSVGKFEPTDSKVKSIDMFFNKTMSNNEEGARKEDNMNETIVNVENTKQENLKDSHKQNIMSMLLHHSIKKNGFTDPEESFNDEESDQVEQIIKSPNKTNQLKNQIKPNTTSIKDMFDKQKSVYANLDTSNDNKNIPGELEMLSTTNGKESVPLQQNIDELTNSECIDLCSSSEISQKQQDETSPIKMNQESKKIEEKTPVKDYLEESNSNSRSFFMKYFQQKNKQLISNSMSAVSSFSDLHTDANNLATQPLSAHSTNELKELFICEDTSSSCSSTNELQEILNDTLNADEMHQSRNNISVINVPSDSSEDSNSCTENSANAAAENSSIFKKCTECNKLININEYQCHIDYHIAINLSKMENSTSQKCMECGKFVDDLVSHLDYHLAFRISNEQRAEFRQNRTTNHNSNNVLTNKDTNKSTNLSKRKRTTNGKDIKSKKNKPISAFFNKS